ncbi:hypothetical protein PLICRDRAFT_110377 [Plicaturopsis crispa FD-325 SS-3]|nr:hypothetical protein PLICRDRAFT_110377 [Plicaturopsis crispa FD-325 SS-3]
MPDHPTRITYAAAPSFLASETWKEAHKALLSQLPLRNIHWKSASRPSIRTIQELDVTLVPLYTVRDDHTSQIPVTILEKPFMNIYITTCEDLDSYRASVRKQIKDWHSLVTRKKNQEWLILHIVKPDNRNTGGGFFQMKGSVLDKMRADFNVDKRDRCVQLAWSTGHDNPAAWADLFNKIKDGLILAFNSAVAQREEEVKRSESQRQMPGWNFCTFFILKESLASSFEDVNLFEDALLVYDELEASFFQVLRDKNLSWFGTLISPTAKDDSAPLLSVTKKPYRDLILANTISVFDFRAYLLARQCSLLSQQGRIIEVARKSSAFLGAFGRRLREVENTIPEFFIESWTYSSALSVVAQCDDWAQAYHFEGHNLISFNAVKGELLELARNQLDTLGIKSGHLPEKPPFSMGFPHPSWNSAEPTEKRSSKRISNSELLLSLEDADKFYDLFVVITNRAIDMYAKAGRRKFALKLHGSLAALDVHRGRMDVALQTYTSLPAHYAPHTWTSLESFMLSRAIDTHEVLEKSKDRDWIHIMLSFLKTYVEDLGNEMLIPEDDKKTYVSRLVGAMHTAASELDSAYPDHPAWSIRVSANASPADTEDGSLLDVTVENRLPCDVTVDDIAVVLTGRDAERLRFSTSTKTLAPGKTTLQLFCPTSSSGAYLLDSSEIRISHLLLQWTHRPKNKAKSTVVHIPRDPRALDIRLRPPQLIQLGASSTLLVIVCTGRNRVSNASIKLSTSSGVRFKHKEAKLRDPEGVDHTLEAADESFSLNNVEPDTSVSVLMPHTDASAFHAVKVNIEVEYKTGPDSSATRTLRLTRVVSTALPIAVNVQDFFRGTRLFSKFTISTTSHQHVRIRSAQLDCPDEDLEGVTIAGCMSRGIVTVTPAQPANFLFHIDSTGGPVRESLRLLITYRMLREEVESMIRRTVEDVTKESTSQLFQRELMINRLIEALESDASWVEKYGITGELHVPPHPDKNAELDEALSEVKKIMSTSDHSVAALGDWREIVIPVDVPHMNIIAAARLQVLPTPFSTGKASGRSVPLYAGQPMSALLSIHTSFHWGSNEGNQERKYAMRFDVEEMVRDWLVSGRKRGDFTATDGATFTFPITLIALHHGELALPKIAVTPLPIAGELTMGSMALPSTETYQAHGAEKVLVLPRGGRSTFVIDMGRDE